MSDRIQKLIEQLSTNEARFARKSINYYDGRQVEEITAFLSSAESFRKHWKEKGQVPRTRNITKAIVDKSGLLFSGNEPKLEVWSGDSINLSASQTFKDLMDDANWIEFFTNFDNQVRMLKSGLVLVQWDAENKRLILDALHVGNSVVTVDYNSRVIKELLIMTSQDGDEIATYRHFTLETITDYSYNVENKQLQIEAQFDNPYGIVPATPFYDTATPRTGVWNVIPRDLVGLNEMYNLHLMDSEYSAAWSKVKTLFTNADIDGSGNYTETYDDPVTGMPRQVPAQPHAVGGPGRVVKIDGDNIFLEYKGPDVSLTPIEEIFSNWVKDFAADWSVRLQSSGDASATSGFQLIVEELPNLELRKQRQKMFEAGFNRLYKVVAYVTQGIPGINLPLDAYLDVIFGAPALPIDEKAVEDVWSRRIIEGRASRIDYFMEVKGMSKEEALEKVAEIDAINSIRPQTPTRNTTVQVI